MPDGKMPEDIRELNNALLDAAKMLREECECPTLADAVDTANQIVIHANELIESIPRGPANYEDASSSNP